MMFQDESRNEGKDVDDKMQFNLGHIYYEEELLKLRNFSYIGIVM